MVEPNFMDDVDCGSFFDHIDDLLDFSSGDVAAGASSLPGAAVSCHSFPSIWPTESDSAELSVPYEDTVPLEWQPNFVEDFSCGSLTLKKVEPPGTTADSVQNQFQISSPVSVLESSSSCEKTAPRSPEIYIPVPCVRARSKRRRPANFKPHPVMQLISPTSSVGDNTMNNAVSKASSDSENFAESRPVIKIPKQASGEHKKKKIRLSLPLGAPDPNQIVPSQAVRTCMHCEITRTPQWRAGPLGPKTLCNACGVRYKSGRLFPEYRPAASPTFCPLLHSNSHQKVIEMRSKASEITASTAAHSAASPDLIPNTNSSLTLDYMDGFNGGIGEIDDDNILAIEKDCNEK